MSKARVKLYVKLVKLDIAEDKILIAYIKYNYKDVILFTAVNIEVEDEVLIYRLVALSIKPANYNRGRKNKNRRV